MVMAPLLAKYHAIAAVMASPPAIHPKTPFMKARSSETMGAVPEKPEVLLFPPKMRGGS